MIVAARQIAGVIGDADEVEPRRVVRVAHGVEQRSIDDAAVLGDVRVPVQSRPRLVDIR